MTSGVPRKVLKIGPTLPSSWRYRSWSSRNQYVSELTPLSSVAVPVIVKLVDGSTLVPKPPGPVIAVVGVWSSVPNDSNFFVAGVESAVPPVAAVNAVAVTSRFRFVATRRLSRLQLRVVVPAPRVALTVVAVVVHVLLAVRY